MCQQLIPIILFLLLGSTLIANENILNKQSSKKEVSYGSFVKTNLTHITLDTLKATLVEGTIKDACPRTLNGSFAIQIMGGTPPYQIIWKDQKGDIDGPLLINNANDTVIISSLPPGDYTYSVFDNGFGATTQSVTAPTPITIGEANLMLELTESNPISCFEEQDGALQAKVFENGVEEIDLNQYQFEWYRADGKILPFASSSLIEDLPFGEYTAVAIDSNNCQVSRSVTLDQPKLLQSNLTIQKAPTCVGTLDGIVEVNTISGGTSPYNIQWSNEETSLENQNLGIGKHSYILTDTNGCINQDTIELSAKLAIAIDSVINPIRCHDEANGEIILIGAINDVANDEQPAKDNFIFDWSPNAPVLQEIGDSSFLLGLVAGKYEVVVTHADLPNGCQVTQEFILSNPAKLVLDTLSTIPLSACKLAIPDGEASVHISGGTGSYQYEWTDYKETVFPNQASISDIDTGFLSLTVEDAMGCQITRDTFIRMPFPPKVLSFEDKMLPCALEVTDLEIQAVAGETEVHIMEYIWSHDGTIVGNKARNVGADTIAVTIIDENNCQTLDTAIINTPNPVHAMITFDPIVCFGESTFVQIINPTGGSEKQYTFSIDGSTFQTVDAARKSLAGEHVVTIKDGNNCIFDTLLTIPSPNPLMVEFEEPRILVNRGKAITLDLFVSGDEPIAEILWDTEDPIIDDSFQCDSKPCFSPTVQPIENALYQANVVDQNGCEAKGEIVVQIIKNRQVFIPNVFAPNSVITDKNRLFKIFTTNGFFQLNSAKVFDRWGTLVVQHSTKFPNSDGIEIWDGMVNGRMASQGVYWYVIEVEFLDIVTGKRTREVLHGDVTLIR